MRKFNTAVSLLVILIISSCIQVKQEKKYEQVNRSTITVIENEVETPWGEVIITEPDFANTEEFFITDFGAVAGDKEKISEAIGKAIDERTRRVGAKY